MAEKTRTRLKIRHKFDRVRIEYEGTLAPAAQRAFIQALSRKALELFGYDSSGLFEFNSGWILQVPSRTHNQDWLLNTGINFQQAAETETEEQKRGFEIRLKRLELGLSQTELAQKAGLERSHLSHIERGKCRSRKETMNKILEALANATKPHFVKRTH